MPPPEIELIFFVHEASINLLRSNLRKAMQRSGYLPHWKESYSMDQGPFQAIIKVNGKRAWRGDIKEVTLLSPDELILLMQQNKKRGFRWKRALKVQISFFSALVIAFFPKCPFCWAAYMSVFSSLGLGRLPYKPWLLPVFIILLFLNIISLYLSRKRHGYKPMLLALTGAALITLNRFYWQQKEMMIIGALFLITASLWNSLPKRMLISLRYYFLQWGTKGG
jgi:mercuric ion transport protein